MKLENNLIKPICLVLCWLVVVNIFALVALNRFNLNADTAYTWINPKDFHQEKSWNFIDLHSHWDSVWYQRIAEQGYSYTPGEASSVVFFPLYPFLIYLVSFLTFGNTVLAGWILSTIFLFLAVIYLYKLVSEFHRGVEPFWVIMFLLVFPTATFYNAVYTESLFLFLSVACFYYALKKNFLVAGLLGFMASFTRITGMFLMIPILMEYFRDYSMKGLFKFKIIPILAIPLGTVMFFASEKLLFGDFFLFLKAQQWFGREFGHINTGHFVLNTSPAVINFSVDLSFVVLAGICLYFLFKIRPSYAVYTFLLVIVPLSTGTLMSIGRYLMVAFPIYILFASVKNEYFRFSFLLLSTLLFAMNIILFVNNYWAG